MYLNIILQDERKIKLFGKSPATVYENMLKFK